MVFLSALRVGDLHAMLGLLAKNFFEHLAFLEVNGRMDAAGKIRSVEIQLLQQGRKKLGRIELFLIFPVKVSPVDYASPANVKQIHGYLRWLGVPPDHVCVVTGSSRDFLAFLHFRER